MQTRFESFIESIINILIGFGVAVGAQIAIFPLFDINVSVQDNFAIGAIFTLISLVRSYLVRRLFNSFLAKNMRSQH